MLIAKLMAKLMGGKANGTVTLKKLNGTVTLKKLVS
ncbi:hypothetical protein PSBY109024_00005 [Pseudoalteromonas byunsanensis]